MVSVKLGGNRCSVGHKDLGSDGSVYFKIINYYNLVINIKYLEKAKDVGGSTEIFLAGSASSNTLHF